MKTKWSIVMALVLLAALAVPLSVAAGGDKVTICHKPNTPDEVTIEVSGNALDAHLAHGDYPGACTHTEILTCPFEGVAIPVIGPDPVMFTVASPATPYGWETVIWSSTGQNYLGSVGFPGYPPPPPDAYWLIPGSPRVGESPPNIETILDLYIAKANPEDADFDLMLSCTVPPP